MTTRRPEEAKAELREEEQKLADAKAELKETEGKLEEAEAKLEQVQQELMEAKQAGPPNTAKIQLLEEKLQRLKHAFSALQSSLDSKRGRVQSLEALVGGLEHRWLSALVGSPSAAERGHPAVQKQSTRRQHQPSSNTHRLSSLLLCLSLSLL